MKLGTTQIQTMKTACTPGSPTHACIVGNDMVKFNHEGKLLSKEELGLTVQDLDRWEQPTLGTPVFDISHLTPLQQDWVHKHGGASGMWRMDFTESPYARIDDTNAWDPSKPISNHSWTGPKA